MNNINLDKKWDFKSLRKKAENYLGEYHRYNLLLSNTNNQFIKGIFSKKAKIKYISDFIKGIDLIFTSMNEEHVNLLKNIHIKRVPFEQLGYSKSHFYEKYRKAVNEFIEIVE